MKSLFATTDLTMLDLENVVNGFCYYRGGTYYRHWEVIVHVGNFNNKNGNDKSVRLVCKNQFGIEGINKKFKNYHL